MVLGRLMLIAGVLLFAYCFALAGAATPWVLAAGVVCFFGYLAKLGGKRLTTLGSARWADAEDLGKAGMLTAKNGLTLGRLAETRRQLLPALGAL